MQFFSVIKSCLSEEIGRDFDPQPLAALILNSANVFSTGLVGVSILLPDIVQAAKLILLAPNGTNKEYLSALQQREALADARKQEFDWVQISGNCSNKIDATSLKFWKPPASGING